MKNVMFSIIISLFLASCSGNSIQTPEETATNLSTQYSSTSVPSKTASPVSSITPTITESPSPTPTPKKIGLNVPTAALARLGSGLLNEISVSPDGKSYAVASSTGVNIYDFKTHDMLLSLGTGIWIASVNYSPDGLWLVTGSSWNDNSVSIWEATSGKLIRKYSTANNVSHAKFSPDGKFVAGATWDGEILIWDSKSTNRIRTLKGYPNFLYSFDFSPDGSIVAGVGRDSNIVFWDTKTGDVLLDQKTAYFLNVLTFFPVSNKLAVPVGLEIQIWDSEKQSLSGRLKNGSAKGDFNDIAISPDEKWLISGQSDGNVLLWDLDSLALVQVIEGDGDAIASVKFSLDGKYILTGTENYSIKIWDTDTKAMHSENVQPGHGSYISSLAVSPTEKKLISGSADSNIIVWDLDSLLPLYVDRDHLRRVEDVQFFRDGKSFISVTCSASFKVSNAQDYSAIKKGTWDTSDWCAGDSSVAISHNLEIFAIGTASGSVEIRDNKKYSRISRVFVKGAVTSLKFSPDDQYLVAAHSEMNKYFVSIIDVKTNLVVDQITTHTTGVNDLDFSPDGKYLASASSTWFSEGEIIIWDMIQKKIVRTQPKGAHTISYSPNGRYLASDGLWDYKVVLWDALTGKQIHTYAGHSMLVYALEFSSDGKFIYSGSYD
ncbi:MAG: hypothetical protein NT121_03220, partial [Chloroflexi bacterium]|nr:hypothetical protein [Chloroflexota bacterium]